MRDSTGGFVIIDERRGDPGPDVEALMEAMDRELERALEIDRVARGLPGRGVACGPRNRPRGTGEARWRAGAAVIVAATVATGVAMAATVAATAPQRVEATVARGVIGPLLGSGEHEVRAVPAPRMVPLRGGSIAIDGSRRAVDDFELQNTEVTRAQFAELMGYDPSRDPSCGPRCPVDRVSWDEAAAYCNARSARAGLAACYECSGEGPAVRCDRTRSPWLCRGYRLPTPLEWEYAARAGRAPGAAEAVIGRAASGATRASSLSPVAMRGANPWELHDLVGNAWEWTDDEDADPLGRYEPGYGVHVVRGGAWYSRAVDASPAGRASVGPGFTRDLVYRPGDASTAPAGATLEAIGFRVARSMSAAALRAR